MKRQCMRRVITVFALAGGLFAAPGALVIDLPSNVTTPANGHILGASNPGAGDIALALGIPAGDLGSLLYKIESDGTEEGLLRASYSTAAVGPAHFTAEPVTISYVGGKLAAATYLLVKDGYLGSYLFNIGPTGLNWNGVEDIEVHNVFAPLKSLNGISHVEFYGSQVTVPEPATTIAGALLLLPFAFCTFRMLRRMHHG